MKRFLCKKHGRNSVELKFRYLIDKSSKRRRDYFHIKFYFFFPYAFNIGPSTYDRTDFFADQKLYLRFNTPVFLTDELLQAKNSPLLRLESMLDRSSEDGGKGAPFNYSDFVYESKLLGSVYKSLHRELYYWLRKRLRRDEEKRILEEAPGIFEQANEIARRCHQLTARVLESGELFSPEVSNHLLMIDEYLSLVLERYYLWAFQLLGSKRLYRNFIAELERRIKIEMEYRAERGYPTVTYPNISEARLEEYVYRSKILKRYVSEVLFFRVRKLDQGKGIEHLLYAVAAGVAMVLATSLAFFGQSAFGNLSISLFVVLVVGYMLKDRVKELFRDIFSKFIGKYFYDRRVKVSDPRRGRRLAVVKDKVYFSDSESIPEEILQARNRGSFERSLAKTANESILVYEKMVRLHSGTLKHIHNRIRGLADISIISVRQFLRYLSVQKREIPLFEDGKIVELKSVQRLYHMNVVVSYQGADISFRDKIRLVVDGKGIRRIEKTENSR